MLVRLYQEGDTFLHRLNPMAKLAGLALLTLAPTLFLDPVTPAVFLVLALAMAWGLGGVSPRVMGQRLAPMLLLAVGIGLSSTLFYAGQRTRLLLEVGPFDLYAEALGFGLSMSLRILCMVAYSALFTFTTDPTRFVYSLMQQAGVGYRVGYTIMAAYRFLPILQREMVNISAAHSVRGAYSERSLTAGWDRLLRYGIPLLANGIRQADRMAVAMDARGFSAAVKRTYYLKLRLTRADWLFLAAVLLTAIVLLLILAHFGLLRGFLVGVSDTMFGTRGAP